MTYSYGIILGYAKFNQGLKEPLRIMAYRFLQQH